jgi:uncharacterized protein (DUF885 family)
MSSDAGAWKLPEGDAYYAWTLQAGTTTKLTPEEVHKLGLEQLRQLQDRMEPLLRAQGLTKEVVTNGNVPLTLLDDVIADFIARERKATPRE